MLAIWESTTPEGGAMVMTEISMLADAQLDQVCDALPLARLLQGNGDYLIAWLDREPIGHVYVAWTAPPELQDLYVLDAHRRTGVATALLAAAEGECRRRSCAEVRVTVSVDGDAAQTLYAALGYRDVGIAPRRVLGTVQIRTGPLEVDDTLLTLVKQLPSG
jgi:GNAT superfamily N-acetyltransferase